MRTLRRFRRVRSRGDRHARLPRRRETTTGDVQDHQKALVKLITGLSHRHGQWQVFSDFAEMGAISISNAVDYGQRERREARYMEIVSRYKPDEIDVFPKMLGQLVMALEQALSDVLGPRFTTSNCTTNGPVSFSRRIRCAG